MLTIISHELCHQHDAGPDHPDKRQRLEAIGNQLISSGLEFVARHHDAPRASRSALARVHTEEYLDRIDAASPGAGFCQIDGDTVLSVRTVEAAERAAGAGILGVDLLLRGEASVVFCPIRPPGHHAEPDAAMGFCLYNNVAVAAAHAIDEHRLSRVAIIDFDAHHGNGTERAFCNDERVLFCSSFQHPFYPNSGVESPCRNCLSVPLSAGTTGKAFREATAAAWTDRLDAFQPELVIFSAGFDAHALDDMSDLALVEADFAWLTAEIRRVTAAHCRNRYLSVLEGGYETGSLARSVVSHLRALVD